MVLVRLVDPRLQPFALLFPADVIHFREPFGCQAHASADREFLDAPPDGVNGDFVALGDMTLPWRTWLAQALGDEHGHARIA